MPDGTLLQRLGPSRAPQAETFASVLQANLGKTICEQFYFPYARKIWGREPEELSAIQARRRVSAGTFRKLIGRLAKPPGSGKFYYPRRGYGQISEAYAAAAREHGAEMLRGWSAASLAPPENENEPWVVKATGPEGATRTLESNYVWSTIPVTAAVRMMSPSAPDEVLHAALQIEYRAMVLVYVELDTERFTTTDAHYFPEEQIAMTRLSEPKNYYGSSEPEGRTTLCAELPCRVGDEIWRMDDEQLGSLVSEDMARAGLPLSGPPVSTFSRRLGQAYPIYAKGYEEPLRQVDDWVASLAGFLSYGRQGAFRSRQHASRSLHGLRGG